MLVLGRSEGESIVLLTGDIRIVVHVVQTRQGFMRLAVDAPREVQIYRGEIEPDAGKKEGPQ